jgi:hypothetical protein
MLRQLARNSTHRLCGLVGAVTLCRRIESTRAVRHTGQAVATLRCMASKPFFFLLFFHSLILFTVDLVGCQFDDWKHAADASRKLENVVQSLFFFVVVDVKR